MTRPIQLLDVVALTEDIADRNLNRGQVGTVVEWLDEGVFELEFSDAQGQTYATLAVPEEKLTARYHQRLQETVWLCSRPRNVVRNRQW